MTRINPAPDANLVGRIFLRDRLVVVAAPHLLRPTDGSPVPAVTRGAHNASEAWTVGNPSGEECVAVQPILSLSSLFMVRDAVRRGIGVAKLPVSLVSRGLANRTLVSLGVVDTPATELWLLHPSRRLLSARVAAFLEFIRDTFPSGTPEELAAYTS